jgi:serine/threonine-protein kinase
MDEAAVERALTTYKLRGERSEGPNELAAGKVFEQSPEAGLKVNEGSVVRYTVSTGPGSIAIPDIRNFDRKDAEQELKQAGFTNIAFEERDDPNTGKDKVIETDPAIGSSAAKDTRITVIVASGKVTVPEGQVGRDWSLVSNELARAGLNPKRVDVDSAETPGTVISVEKEGRRVDVGSEIKVEVAKAAAPPPTTETVTKTVTQSPTSEPTTTTEPPGGGGNGG